MAVTTSKRTQTNFDVNAVWQYLTWKNVVREDIDIEEYGETCRARLSRLIMDCGVILFCSRSEVAVLTTRCLGADASSSCSTCKTVPNICMRRRTWNKSSWRKTVLKYCSITNDERCKLRQDGSSLAALVLRQRIWCKCD